MIPITKDNDPVITVKGIQSITMYKTVPKRMPTPKELKMTDVYSALSVSGTTSIRRTYDTVNEPPDITPIASKRKGLFENSDKSKNNEPSILHR